MISTRCFGGRHESSRVDNYAPTYIWMGEVFPNSRHLMSICPLCIFILSHVATRVLLIHIMSNSFKFFFFKTLGFTYTLWQQCIIDMPCTVFSSSMYNQIQSCGWVLCISPVTSVKNRYPEWCYISHCRQVWYSYSRWNLFPVWAKLCLKPWIVFITGVYFLQLTSKALLILFSEVLNFSNF